MEIREMSTLQDFQTCVEIQKQVWGFDDPYDAVPVPLLMVSARNDGIVLGAYEGDQMIGFVYSLPGTHQGKRVQWSHMLAILETYRNSDIGYKLKMEQYRISQEKGYELIEWTYDPLESRNAHFNLKKLGCTALEYEVNIYGETSSPLHIGMPTDRLIAHWKIPPLQKTLPDWKEPPQPPQLITRTHREGEFVMIDEVDLEASDEFLLMEIPENMQKLKAHSREAALQWRLKTREAFLGYFSKGYVAYSFVYWKNPPSGFYVLRMATEVAYYKHGG